MGRIVSITLDEFGRELTHAQFTEAMLALFENIAGLETLTRKRQQQYVNLLWADTNRLCWQSSLDTDLIRSAIPTWNAAPRTPILYHSDGANMLHCGIMQ